MRGAISAIAVSACLLTQGCGTLVATQWPTKSRRKVVVREAQVSVRAAPSGAVVTTADGKTVLGPAPRDIVAEYDEVLTWREDSMWGPGVGISVGVGTILFSTIRLLATKEVGEPYGRLWLGMTLVGIADTYAAGMRLGVYQMRNDIARRAPTRTPVPKDVGYQVRWVGFDPEHVVVRYPHDSTLVATRPSTVSFDQALLHWERSAARTPTPVAMFRLGTAHLAHATAKADRRAAAKAVSYFERYLASSAGAGEHRAEAEAGLARARELAK